MGGGWHVEDGRYGVLGQLVSCERRWLSLPWIITLYAVAIRLDFLGTLDSQSWNIGLLDDVM